MIEAVLLLAIVVLAIMLQDTRGRLTRLEKRWVDERPVVRAAQNEALETAEDPIDSIPDWQSSDAGAPAEAIDAPNVEPLAEHGEPSAALASHAQRFEAIVGGRLPIWIGGIALAFAGFFLVRYSIELGLFGPGARSLLAAAFGLALLALSEFGPRVPWLGGFVGSDKRIAQSLAGAGIATLYGTLYMASELYGLIGIGVAFVLVVSVTVLALALSLRHGPPTAIMGLAGGYLAPYVAGLPESSLASTLLYLGVFTLGLTGLAVWRGWRWLALAAGVASLIWTGSLLAIAETEALWSIGVLLTVIVIATLLAIGRIGRAGPEIGGIKGDLLVLAPLALGALQLVTLAAMIDFAPLSWLLLAVLAATTIIIVWRDELPSNALGIAFALSLIALAGSLMGEDATTARLIPAIGLALLFGAPALIAVARGKQGDWPAIGILAAVAPLCIAMFALAEPGRHIGWAMACAVAAVPVYAIRRLLAETTVAHRSALAALLAIGVALIGFALPGSLYPIGYALLFAVFALWRRGDTDSAMDIRVIALMITAVAMLLPAAGLVEIVGRSIGGAVAHFAMIPPLSALVLKLALPGVVVNAIARRVAMPAKIERVAVAVAGLALLGFAYAILKQPLAIATVDAFVARGFVERAVLTQLLLGAALWMMSRGADAELNRLGLIVAALALARFVWFDLAILNPVIVPQSVGPVPIANAATIHAAGIASGCWWLARLVDRGENRQGLARLLRYASLAIMVLTVLVSVRQLAHGSIIAGQAIATGENYLYSAALLLLSLGWLAVGIVRRVAVLRVAGLALLTAVTLKVFLVDAAALAGLLRVVSFLGLGAALIGIGWAYGKIAGGERAGGA